MAVSFVIVTFLRLVTLVLVSVVSRSRWFRFFLALRLTLGLIAVAVVSHRFFLVSRVALGLLVCGGFVFAYRYSSASYCDHSF